MAARSAFRQQFLFQCLVPLSRSVHAHLGIDLNGGFAPYEWHLVPIVLSEVQRAAASYPIVVTNEREPQLCALIGLHPTRSLFLERNGSWVGGHYVPLYFRQVPFFVSPAGPNQAPTIHVDIDAPSIDECFADKIIVDGGINPKLNDRVSAATAVAAERNRTASFVNALGSAKLLRKLRSFSDYSTCSVASDLLAVAPGSQSGSLTRETVDTIQHCVASLGRIGSLRALQEARYAAEEQMDRPDL